MNAPCGTRAAEGADMLVGFGRASLWGSFATTKTLADEVDVRALAGLRAGEPAQVRCRQDRKSVV